MKPALVDTDILSEFLRGTPKVVENAEIYLATHDALNFSIITFYEILNGLLYKDAKNQLRKFTAFVELSKVLPLTMSAAKQAAELYAEFKKNRSTNWSHRLFDCRYSFDERLATGDKQHRPFQKSKRT